MGEWLLALLSPERIQQMGIAATTVIGAFTARQAREVKKLRAEAEALKGEVAELKSGRAEDQAKFREAVRFIRKLLAHIDHLDTFLRQHAPEGQPPNLRPEIPESLIEEI